jgi:hypothetical protein
MVEANHVEAHDRPDQLTTESISTTLRSNTRCPWFGRSTGNYRCKGREIGPVTEPEAGTKWRIRQAGSLTAKHRDRDGQVGVPRLGQNREAAGRARQMVALQAQAGCGAPESGKRLPRVAIRPSLQAPRGKIAAASCRGVLAGIRSCLPRKPIQDALVLLPGVLPANRRQRGATLFRSPSRACSRAEGGGSLLTCDHSDYR